MKNTENNDNTDMYFSIPDYSEKILKKKDWKKMFIL